MRRGSVVAASALLAASMLSGCTVPLLTPDSTPSPSVATSAPLAVLADHPKGERVYGFLENQRGMNTLGPLVIPSPQLAVSFRCVGEGRALVDISGIGQFPYTCVDGPDRGIRNVFAATGSGAYTVKVMALNDVMWAVTVSEPIR